MKFVQNALGQARYRKQERERDKKSILDERKNQAEKLGQVGTRSSAIFEQEGEIGLVG